MGYLVTGDKLELHLSNQGFGPKYNKKIKAVCGDPGKTRGASYHRFVDIPTSSQGIDLAFELIQEFGLNTTTVIFRPQGCGRFDSSKIVKIKSLVLGGSTLTAFRQWVAKVEAQAEEARAQHRAVREAEQQARENARLEKQARTLRDAQEVLVQLGNPETLNRLGMMLDHAEVAQALAGLKEVLNLGFAIQSHVSTQVA